MKRTIIVILTGLFFITMAGCKTKPNLQPEEGYLNVTGGKIWYKVCGEGNKVPIVMLHGGPGYPSYYLNPLLTLSKERPIVIFDQLGCGRSDRIIDTSFMTIENYVDQLNQLIKALKIKDFYLYGHSWGTILGLEYYLKYPDGIKALIMASPCISSKLWAMDADTLISMLPDSIQLYLKQRITTINFDSLKYLEALNYFYSSYYTRKQPISADFDSADAQNGINVYEYMWGKEEYSITGTLKNYDRTNDLKSLKIPTLYITGEFDAARPNTVEYFHSLTSNSKFIVINNSGHDTMQDNPEENIDIIQTFINNIELEK